jgi:hypothetical protein
VAVVRVRGYAGTGGNLALTCKEKSLIVAHRTVNLEKGFFSDTVSIRLPTSRTGRFLYTVNVASADDTLRRALYFPQTVVAGRFTARIIAGAPSLDQRFLTLALQNDPQWSINSSSSREYDALFFIDFNRAVPDTLTTVANRCIVVFLGVPPCEGKTAISPASLSLVTYQPEDSLFQQFGAMNLPPPSHLYNCPAPFLSCQRPVLGCLVPHDNTTRDTIPFLSVGTFERHDAIAIAGRDLWHMDFWPLSVAGGSETASFLQYIAAFVKQQIIFNGSRSFFTYPSAAEVYENDSLFFTVLLPSDFNETAGNNLVRPGDNAGCTVSFTIDSLSRTVCTTGWMPVNFKAPLRGTVALPPLASGTYHYRCRIEAKGLSWNFEDSLHVDKNREELSVTGQNTAMLDQFSLPLKKNTVASVLDAYADASASKRTTVFETLEIRKSWFLLSVIILLMAVEWLARKRLELE